MPLFSLNSYINNRPRKRLGFRTLNGVFFGKQEIALTVEFRTGINFAYTVLFCLAKKCKTNNLFFR